MHLRRFLITFTLLFLSMASFSQTAARASIKAPEIPYEKYKLPNGLEVILVKDTRLPLVGVDLWYHVGPVKERAGRTGFAHLFEHMMFEGSKHVGEKAHFKYLEASGASDINGTTDFDRTNYFETMPSNELEMALWLESDRMGFLLDTLDAAKLTNQRDVVRNERRQSIENQPYGLVEEAMFHQLFPKDHPYYASVIGSHQDIEAARLNDVRDFFQQYYTPNNATVAIVGNIDTAQTKALVEKYFGPIPSGPPVPPVKVNTPAITSQRREIVTDTVQLPRVYLAWLTPAAFAPGDADAEMAASILGGGKSSRLYRKLVYEQQIAQDASCEHQSLALGSPFICQMTARPGVKPEQLEQAAEQEIQSLVQSGPTQAELERARNTHESRMIRQLERLGGFGGVADSLNFYNQYTGDPGHLPKDLARYNAVTIASVQQAAKTMLGENQRVVIYGVPGKKVVNDVPRSPADTDANIKIQPEYTAQFDQAQAWRNTAPKPGPQPALHLPQPVEATLKNGMKLYVVENHALPIVSARLSLLGGAEADNAKLPGVAGFTAAMLTEGTTHRTAPQIADETAQLGATLTKGSNSDVAFINVSTLTNTFPQALALAADLAVHPAFDAKEIERIRKERQTNLTQIKDNPQQLAREVSVRALYGPDSSYGYIALGTPAALASITHDDLAQFWAAHYTPQDAALVLSGDITVTEARSLAEQYFGAWSGTTTGSGKRSLPPSPPAAPTRKIILVDLPGAPQSVINAVGLGITRSSADYVPATVMNNMLGGLFSSRINMNLREQHGYTYGAFSFFDDRRGVGPIIAGAGVRTDVTAPAVKELFTELDRIRTDPLNAQELRMSKDSIMRSLPADFETNTGAANRISEIWTYGLPLDYYQHLPGSIEAVTSDQARDAALKYIRPENMLLITVGDKAKVAPSLEQLHLGPIESWTTDAQPAEPKQ